MKHHIILASTSPRRRELIQRLPYSVSYRDPGIDESLIAMPDSQRTPDQYALEIAQAKARAIDCANDPQAAVIALDTIVIFQNSIFGKPQSYEEAFSMLKRLSGEWHRVCTAVCIAYKQKETIHAESTLVHIPQLHDNKIHAFLTKEQWRDKAGGYGIQTEGALIIDEIRGCYYNVVGFPLFAVNKLLSRLFRP